MRCFCTFVLFRSPHAAPMLRLHTSKPLLMPRRPGPAQDRRPFRTVCTGIPTLFKKAGLFFYSSQTLHVCHNMPTLTPQTTPTDRQIWQSMECLRLSVLFQKPLASSDSRGGRHSPQQTPKPPSGGVRKNSERIILPFGL